MANEDSHDSEMKLSDFLHSLYPDFMATKTQRYESIFRFFYDILAFNKLSTSINTILWGLIYLSIDFFILLMPLDVKWFQPDITEDLGISSLFSAIITRQVTALLLIIMSLFIIIHWYTMALYNHNPKMSSKKATLLYFSVVHAPILFTIFIALCFGELILIAVEDTTSREKSITYIFACLCVFLVYTIDSTIFFSITRFSLHLGEGIFSFWEPPFFFIDFLCIFAIISIIPFRGSKNYLVSLIPSIISFLWGCSMIKRRVRPVIISYIGNIIETKLIFDSIAISIYSLITIWFQFDHQLFATIYLILIVISLMLAIMYVYRRYKVLDPGFEKKGQVGYDQSRIPNSNSAVAALRFNVCFGSSTVTDINFLKWSLFWRFSPEIMPDIVRLLIVLDADISEFVIPKFNVSPVSLIPLKYLAFEFRFYERFKLNDNDIQIASLKEDLEQQIRHIEQVSRDFWTTRDENRRSLNDFGLEIEKATLNIKRCVFFFSNSKTITQIWKNYVYNVIYQPKKYLLLHSPIFSQLERPGYTVYGFIDPRTAAPTLTVKRSRVQHKADKIFKRFRKKTLKPVASWIYYSIFISMLIILPYSILFAKISIGMSQFYADMGGLCILSVSLIKKLLTFTDPIVDLPPAANISLMLNISLLEATYYRNNIEIKNPKYNNVTKYMMLFDHYESNLGNNEQCGFYSLALLTKISFGSVKTYQSRSCHFKWALAYSKDIGSIIDADIDKFKAPFPLGLTGQIVFLVVYFIIFTAVIVVLVVKQKKNIRRAKKILRNIRLMEVKEVKEMSEPFFAFSPMIYGIIWIVLFASVVSTYLCYFLPIRSTVIQTKSNARQMNQVATICSTAMTALSAAMFSILEKDDSEYYLTVMNRACQKLIGITQVMTQETSNTYFSGISIFTSGTNYQIFQYLVDFTHFLTDAKLTKSSFSYIMARYIFINNITRIVNVTLPALVGFASDIANLNGTTFWSVTPVILIVQIILVFIVLWIENQQKRWFNGATFYYRRAFHQNPETTIYLFKSIMKQNETYFDDIPVPILIRNKEGIILFANRKATSLTAHSIEQTLGQPYSEFLDENGPKYVKQENLSLTADIQEMSGGLELVVFRDTTEIHEKNKVYEDLIQRTTTDIGKLPFRCDMIYIAANFDYTKYEVSRLFEIMDEVQNKFPDVHRIAVGATFLRAISSPNSAIQMYQYAISLARRELKEGFMIVITEGYGSAISLNECGSLVRITGKLNKRADDAMIRGVWNRIYVDESIYERIPQEIKELPENSPLILTLSPT